MNRIFGNLRNPWRYPEFMEYGMAMAGFAQTLIAWYIGPVELGARHGLIWTIVFNPSTWASIGIALALLHLYGLWLPGGKLGQRVRLTAAHLSCAFWTHFVGTTTALALWDEQAAMPTLAAAALVAPYTAFVVCVRLRKEWQ
jgi:hypothetical protein